MLVVLSILPTFEAESTSLVEARSHGGHAGRSPSKKKRDSEDSGTSSVDSRPPHLHSGPAFIVILLNPDGTELKMNSNECPVPYCVSADNKYCGTEEQCEDAKVDGSGEKTALKIVLYAVGAIILANFLYKCVWEKMLKKKF